MHACIQADEKLQFSMYRTSGRRFGGEGTFCKGATLKSSLVRNVSDLVHTMVYK